MPFHGHHPPPASGQYDANAGQHGTSAAVYQVSQALGTVGAPSGNLRISTSGNTAMGRETAYHPLGNGSHPGGGGQTAPPTSSGLPRPGPGSSPAPMSSMLTSQYTQDSSRRAQPLNRQPEELHMLAGNSSMGQQSSREGPQHQPYRSTHDYAGGPRQPMPSDAPHSHTSVDPSLPGALQPGNPGRPGPLSANTAPSTVPTLPQISTQPPSQTGTSRSNTTHHSHNYSRSSPADLDQQKYAPMINTPEGSKYGTPTSKTMSSQTPYGIATYSPLGLADIRPRADSGMSDDPSSANPYANDEGYASAPTNSSYVAPWAIYAFDWCKWPVQQHGSGDAAGKMAIGSYLEDGHNFIQILDTRLVSESEPDPSPGAPQYGLDFVKTAEATHSYPVTRILWEPASSQKQSTDLLATSGDHLRLWSLPSQSSYNSSNSITQSSNGKDSIPQKLTPLALLSNSKSPEHTAPLTSLDWNTVSPSLIITSSIDTTCTIWDIPTLTAKTQLIAHDKEVFDVRFCANSTDVFVSCGADGSVRMFDLRSLEHSTIIYEPTEKNDKSASTSPPTSSPTRPTQQTLSYAPPLLRLAASPHDAHLLATFSADSSTIRILDVRQPGQALLELAGHAAPINCIEWSPARRGTLASGADDSLVLIWDLLNQENSARLDGVNGSGGAAELKGGAAGGGGLAAATAAAENVRGPAAAWRCDYEVGNLSWAPGSANDGAGWLGVSGGRGIWGVGI